jgi:hypothetical protein
MGSILAKSYIHARSILYVLLHILIKLICVRYIENNKLVANYLHIRKFKARLETLVNSEFILIFI